ncbi:MAG: FtsX-like permease family protein, partial [Gammaproteobacteria bacterium]
QELDGELADPSIVINTPVDSFTVDPELVQNELKQHPSVLNVTQVDEPPWAISNSSSSFFAEPHENSREAELARHDISYEYFDTTGTRLIAGRYFSRERSNDVFPTFDALNSNRGPFATIITDRAARSMGWDNAQQAIGESIYYRIGPPTLPQDSYIELDIIGAADQPAYEMIDFGVFGIQGDVYLLRPNSANVMIIRVSRSNLNAALRHIDETWGRLMPDVALQRDFTDNVFFETYNLFLGISFAITTLSMAGFLIASIGLLGNATFMTNIRQKEVGIRKVMGASSKRLLRMLLLDFAKPIFIANALAFPLGYVIANGYLSIFATRTDITIWPFLISFFLSGAIAFAAVFSQSWKSSRVRPAMVLRYE